MVSSKQDLHASNPRSELLTRKIKVHMETEGQVARVYKANSQDWGSKTEQEKNQMLKLTQTCIVHKPHSKFKFF